MAIIEFPHFARQSPASQTLGARAMRPVEAALNWVVRIGTALKNRRVAGRLAAWDDRMLGDIGLTRGDVCAALAGPLTDDPTERLVQLSRERRGAPRRPLYPRDMEI